MKKQLTYIAAAFLFSGMVSAQIDLNAMPKPGPTPVINITQPKTFTLKNGLTVMVVENHKLPRVSMNLSMDQPPYSEGAKVGISDIMAEQLENGTTHMSKDDFNNKVDFLGANLNFSSNGASGNTLSKYFPEVLGLMADAITSPKFSAQEIEDTKDRTIEEMKSQDKNASAIAAKVSNALMYGKNTSRGEFETEESIKGITLADVQNNYSKYYIPNNANLVIVGDVKFDETKKLVEKLFSGWKKANTVFAPLEPANNPAATEIDVVDVPSAVQSVVSVGNLHNLKMSDKQYFAAMLGNYILGGGGEARLFMNLREKNGFTYGAYSGLSASKYSPQFNATASVRNEVTDKAVKEFMNELNGITTIKPEELANAKAKLKGDFIRSIERPETIARFALNQKTQNLPADFYTNFLKSIDAVTVQDVANAMKAYVLPGKSRIFVAGKGSQIAPGLEALGYPVKYFDSNANPTSKPAVQQTQAADASVTAASVAEKYITAIGGRDAIAKINSITIDASAAVQGMTLDMNMIRAKGGKLAQEIKMMGNTVSKVVFDGKNGYVSAQGQQKQMDDKMKANFLKETELFPELNFGKSADYKVGPMETINGEQSYSIQHDGTTYYYSVKTGLKTGEVKTANGMAVPTNYSDYKNVSGVMLPYTTTTNMGGMDVAFKVKSYQINQSKDTDFK